MSQDSTPGAAVAQARRISVPRLATPDYQVRYEDVFVRDNFGDTGVIPSADVPYQSPDIIPMQREILSPGMAIKTYDGPDLGLPILEGGTNNVWIRAKNLWPKGLESGTVRLYWSEASLLMDPGSWIGNVATTADGEESVSFVNASGSTDLSPDEIGITQEAFYLTDLPEGHVCFVAVVETPNTPVAIPNRLPSNEAFAEWVQSMPAVAWRNIGLVPEGPPQLLQTMLFGNLDGTDGEFHFAFIGQGLPPKSTMVVQCTNTACPIDQTLTVPEPDRLGKQYTGFDQVVPGRFQSAITVTVIPPDGETFSPGATLTVDFYAYPARDFSEVQRKVGRFVSTARPAADGTVRAATQFLIPLGQCVVRTHD